MDTFVALVERAMADRPAGHINAVASRVVQGGVAAQILSQTPTSSSDPIHPDHPVNLATDNCLWGAERIRGELLKLGIRVSERTI
jgi:hypothetical protein